MPKAARTCIKYRKRVTSDVDRAQIRKLIAEGHKVKDVVRFFRSSPRAVRRARDNDYEEPANLSNDPLLLESEFLALVEKGDDKKLAVYIEASVDAQEATKLKMRAQKRPSRTPRSEESKPLADDDDESWIDGSDEDEDEDHEGAEEEEEETEGDEDLGWKSTTKRQDTPVRSSTR